MSDTINELKVTSKKTFEWLITLEKVCKLKPVIESILSRNYDTRFFDM